MRAGDIVRRYGVTATVLKVHETVALVRVHTELAHEASWAIDECEAPSKSEAAAAILRDAMSGYQSRSVVMSTPTTEGHAMCGGKSTLAMYHIVDVARVSDEPNRTAAS